MSALSPLSYRELLLGLHAQEASALINWLSRYTWDAGELKTVFFDLSIQSEDELQKKAILAPFVIESLGLTEEEIRNWLEVWQPEREAKIQTVRDVMTSYGRRDSYRVAHEHLTKLCQPFERRLAELRQKRCQAVDQLSLSDLIELAQQGCDTMPADDWTFLTNTIKNRLAGLEVGERLDLLLAKDRAKAWPEPVGELLEELVLTRLKDLDPARLLQLLECMIYRQQAEPILAELNYRLLPPEKIWAIGWGEERLEKLDLAACCYPELPFDFVLARVELALKSSSGHSSRPFYLSGNLHYLLEAQARRLSLEQLARLAQLLSTHTDRLASAVASWAEWPVVIAFTERHQVFASEITQRAGVTEAQLDEYYRLVPEDHPKLPTIARAIAAWRNRQTAAASKVA